MDVILSAQAKEVSEVLIGLDIPRIPAEIIGFLLINKPKGVTSAEIQEELGISKAAVSTAMRYLEALEVVGYNTMAGGRKRLIFLKPTKIANYLKRRMLFFGRLTHSLQTIAAKQGNGEFEREIISVATLCRRLDIAVNDIILRWEDDSHEKV